MVTAASFAISSGLKGGESLTEHSLSRQHIALLATAILLPFSIPMSVRALVTALPRTPLMHPCLQAPTRLIRCRSAMPRSSTSGTTEKNEGSRAEGLMMHRAPDDLTDSCLLPSAALTGALRTAGRAAVRMAYTAAGHTGEKRQHTGERTAQQSSLARRLSFAR